MGRNKDIIRMAKCINSFGRKKKRSKYLVIGYYKDNNPFEIQKYYRHKYLKSIQEHKKCSELITELNKKWDDYLPNNECYTISQSIKKSLYFNPLNVTSLFNLVYFYDKIIKNYKISYIYSLIFHTLLMKVLRKFFYKVKYKEIAKERKTNNDFFFRYISYIAHKNDIKCKISNTLIKRLLNKWENIPYINCKVTYLLLLENIYILYLNNYKIFFMNNAIKYANLMIKLLKLNKIKNYMKKKFFFLHANLYITKASCFLMVNPNHVIKDYFFQNNRQVQKITKNTNVDIKIINKQDIENLVNIQDINNYDSWDKQTSLPNQNEKQKIDNLMYEKRFLSYILNEETTAKKVENMNDYFIYDHVNMKCVLKKVNECIDYCLQNRLYKFLEQFLLWRARIFYHLNFFHECLSDSSKVSLLNIYSKASFTNDDIDDLYSCYNMRTLCLKHLNVLHTTDLYIAHSLRKINSEMLNLKKKKMNILVDQKKDKNQKNEKLINERKHTYSWHRSFEDQNIMNFMKENKKKIPFIF
ncbi:conserved Plasmodium protein, unknown function [Plasmodium berghei]|uniref:Uncharacterized protein n=2 Tax=Plasmodium berghei TaxID=5821 RepID=A0A509AQI8_PLABA|nr:conserved Plasmodium protein, unknown function [Plasmodium berghei ANKA]CXJ00116.1 conserved Plasmodium protein, unknown function [Plasmodium berghei]SCL97961.1 conserved Plasmodium protein, unknown function [Plasmodium berghei]SCM16722.1 conserved Plasmodium protein, unknown function [Plasmodium berghei]SCM18520.1 conserved Plasmodium protein, unknown function [Plasmodium berghei]SCN27953.1 conserved Plasmodium protein, unknown function [Plasmodium berghei]|eukprot:XP_034423606.1 conserved Plasmodium protein, unknown function [Plasmodium berghei ANKA]